MAEDGTESSELLRIVQSEENVTIDGKGRINLGKKHRERLGDKFTMAIGELGCVCTYPKFQWDKKIAEIDAADPNNEGMQEYSRLFYGGADDQLSLDPQGRVVVPLKLRLAAKLKEKVHLIAAGERLEIWDTEEYAKFQQNKRTYGGKERQAWQDSYREMKGLPPLIREIDEQVAKN